MIISAKKLLFIVLYGFAIIAQAEVQYPELTFKYDWRSRIMDAVGSLVLRNNVNGESRKQLKEQLPNFVAAWEQSAPILFGEVFNFFKRGFKIPKRTALIYLSHNTSYGSNRFLVLGLQHYLDSEEQWLSHIPFSRNDCFVNLVFHELLHVWVDDNIGSRSQLLTKYQHEHNHTLEHIHLMAIQKMVYLKLNRPDLLTMIDEGYRKFCTPAYKRAWEIVNDIEGYEQVIQDILDKVSVPKKNS